MLSCPSSHLRHLLDVLGPLDEAENTKIWDLCLIFRMVWTKPRSRSTNISHIKTPSHLYGKMSMSFAYRYISSFYAKHANIKDQVSYKYRKYEAGRGRSQYRSDICINRF